MLFNSHVFIFVFLPVVAVAYFALAARAGGRAALAWLTAASLFFYGWWNPAYLPLILGSIGLNFAAGRLITASRPRWRRPVLVLGLAVNLGLLGYFKYAGFLAANANALLGTSLTVEAVVLPLAISFFTFQQIAYLVDVYRGEVGPHGLLDYALFVTFFPQLIAGPIVHHREMMPQFASPAARRFSWDDLAVGASVFVVGLFKKVVLADSLAVHASPAFAAAEAGAPLGAAEAWTGALAYTFQLYFDFSGYSDMALGAARVFGVRLPANFLSPYKATSVVEFWRRWHVTLSRFLRDYLYVPLGGNRRGPWRRLLNLEITMLLGGLWHGAGWTFVAWGALHGLYLGANHLLARAFPGAERPASPGGRVLGWLVTFLAVVVGWVLFRAATLEGAGRMLLAMAGLSGAGSGPGAPDPAAALLLLASLAICLGLPNTWEWALAPAEAGRARRPGGALPRPAFRPTLGYAAALAGLFALATLGLSGESEFLYFQF
jgi:alginate O-acetyltransferase complex protein AlgI